MSDLLLVFCTFPDAATARDVGRRLLEEQLIACVNVIPGVESIYRWQGRVESSAEVLALLKTTHTTYSALEQRLRDLHPYDVPEILALAPERVASEYARWVTESVLTSGEG